MCRVDGHGSSIRRWSARAPAIAPGGRRGGRDGAAGGAAQPRGALALHLVVRERGAGPIQPPGRRTAPVRLGGGGVDADQLEPDRLADDALAEVHRDPRRAAGW